MNECLGSELPVFVTLDPSGLICSVSGRLEFKKMPLVQDSVGFVDKLLLEHISTSPPRPEAPDMTSAILRMFALSGGRAGEFS